VLLLGSSQSGKSTVLKQMRIIGGTPFSDREIEGFRQLVFEDLKGLCYRIDSLRLLGLHLPEALRPAADLIARAPHLRNGEPFPIECLHAFTTLWGDATVQSAVRRGNELAFGDNLPYLFAALPRLFSPSFVPTPDDILHLRSRTERVAETTVNLNGIDILVVDIGGRRPDRRKWMHTFDDVTSIIFAASLGGYDTCLTDDIAENEMQDSMVVWKDICASKYFNQTSIILCFTKNDLFEQKVLTSDIVDFFPDFNGSRGDAAAGRHYFSTRFQRLAEEVGRIHEKAAYKHVVTATDTGMMRGFLNSVGTFSHMMLTTRNTHDLSQGEFLTLQNSLSDRIP
ncbi:heterotrimeric G protein alpha subunit 4, partial [Mycena latifolia]